MSGNDRQIDAFLLSELDDVYGVMRRVQGEYKEHPKAKKTKCIGAGNCCKIGLVVSLMECHNIAKNLRKQYWSKFETEGSQEAERWHNKLIYKLKDSFVDPDWSIEDESKTKRHCVFFGKNGCSIYEFRPFVCRAYGTIAPVETSCPRQRDEDGNIIIFMSAEIDRIIDRFDKVVAGYGSAHPDLNYSLYMPLGVLRFLLPENDFYEFYKGVDEKYTKAIEGYGHQLWKVREND